MIDSLMSRNGYPVLVVTWHTISGGAGTQKPGCSWSRINQQAWKKIIIILLSYFRSPAKLYVNLISNPEYLRRYNGFSRFYGQP